MRMARLLFAGVLFSASPLLAQEGPNTSEQETSPEGDASHADAASDAPSAASSSTLSEAANSSDAPSKASSTTALGAEVTAQSAGGADLRAQEVPIEEVPLSKAELEALGFSTTEGGQVSALDTDLHVSGFLDFNVTRLIAKKDSINRGLLPSHTNFYVGNFNLYLNKNLSETFRTMGEVRFSYLPNGYPPGTASTPGGTPTTGTRDYADNDSDANLVKWGGVEIERVYLEWSPHRFISVRAGQFLTPYGIWNVDHGSPTFIPVQRPYVISGALFPERQTGFEFFGRWDATNKGTLGYHLTLSNGTGPISEYRDLDNNKALGGRLFWEQHGFGEFKIGASAYYGQNTDATSSIAVDASGKLGTVETIHLQYDVLSLAADVVWKWKGLHLQAEFVSQQRKYTSQGRQAVFNPYVQKAVFPADSFGWGTYALAGYRTPWFGIMPYFQYSYMDTPQAGIAPALSQFTGGLNIRAIDSVVVKLEYINTFLITKLLGSDEPFRLIQAQVAWAF